MSSFPPSPKVAFIHQPWSVIDPPINGPDSVALLTDELSRRMVSHAAVSAFCRRWKKQPANAEFRGVKYRRCSVAVDRWIKLGLQTLDRKGWRDPQLPFVASKWCYRQFIDGVIHQLEREPADVVHVQNFSQFVPLLRDALPKTKIVLQMHCEWLNQFRPDVVKGRIAACDGVLGVSGFLADKIKQHFPQFSDRVGHVYNGANPPPPNLPPVPRKEKEILFVGRQSPEKGVHLVLDAFKLVLKAHPDAHLTLIGPITVVPPEMILPFCDDPKLTAIGELYQPGAYEKLLADKVNSFSDLKVTFLREGLDHDRLWPYYQSAQIFCSPSVWEEPFGMPLVESMMNGCCPVASDGGAFPEILDGGEAGCIVERGSVDALANALIDLLGDPKRCRRYGELAKLRAESMFTWDAVGESLWNYYRTLK